MRQISLRVLCVLMMAMGIVSLHAQIVWDGTASAQWTGSGTKDDPYLISNAKQLAGLAKRVNGGNNYGDKYFKLTADILLNDTTNWQNWENQAPANTWTPIGDCNTYSARFDGSFDGGGHTIAGVYMKNYDHGQTESSGRYFGLFGKRGQFASSSNLHIFASYIEANAGYVGLLAGYRGNIENCTVRGKIIARDAVTYVGGFCGDSWDGYITNSSAYVDIIVQNTTQDLYCGGVAGSVSSHMTNTHAYGDISVTCTNAYRIKIGGLAGSNDGGYYSETINCSAHGNVDISCRIGDFVNGELTIGGLIGNNDGYTIQSYATGNVNVYAAHNPARVRTGGLLGNGGQVVTNCYAVNDVTVEVENLIRTCDVYIGGLLGMGQVKDCYYAQGKVKGTTENGTVYAGGLVGEITETNITNSYYNIETSGIADNDNLWAKTTQELKTKLTYNDWEFENVWARNNSINNGYPYFRWSQAEQIDALDLAVTWMGTGTEEDPYQIGTAEQWRGFVKSVNGNTFVNKYITLTNDIFLNDTTGWLDWEFNEPTNNDAPAGTMNNSFRGHFDGAGHTIYGLYIKRTKATHAGLFGVARPGATFKQVRVAASHIEVNSNTGAIYNVGGLVGTLTYALTEYIPNQDTICIDECAADVFIYAKDYGIGTGGLVGETWIPTKIQNSYAQGIVTGWGSHGDYNGGIIGRILHYNKPVVAFISNCYAAALVDGNQSKGGLVGVVDPYDTKLTLVNGYYDQEVSLQTGNNYGALPKLTAEMQRATTYENWDFTNTWGRRNDMNNGYPYLRCFEGKELLNDVEGVALDKHELVLPIDSTDARLVATILPTHHEETACIWTSDSSDIVTVEDGLLIPHKAGETMVRVRTAVGDFVDSCKVTIWVPVDSIVLDYQALTIAVNDTLQLQATIYPLNATNQKVTWKSSYSYYASVSETGLVTTGGSTGTIQIIVTTEENNFTDTCEITIVRPVTGVTISKETLSLVKGRTSTLSASFNPYNATNKNVIWSNTNPAVASVSESGLVTALGGGSDTIIVTTEDGGYSDSCFLTVTVPVSGVELERADTIILVDDAYQMQHTVLPLDATNQAVTYSSNNTSVVSITEDGWLTAIASGSATITVKTVEGSYRATCKVTVEDHAITGVNLRVDHIALYPNESYILNAVVAPANANKQMLVWSSSDEYVATVDEGVVTAHSAGKATITVATPDQSLTATCLLTVVETDFANDILVETTDNSALFTWAKVADAYKYVFAIYTDEVQSQLVCNVTCNAWGQLMDITFPSKKPAAEQPALGTLLQFTIGGLASGTAYNFTLNGYDEENGIVLNQSGQFVTTGNSSTTSVETPLWGVSDSVRKVLENGTLYILRGGEKYTIDGRKVE